MKELFKILVIGFVFLLVLTFGLNAIGLINMKIFAPASEQIRRETFEETKSYNQGVAQEISTFQQQYITATPSQRDALASVILHRTADYDLSKLPPDLRSFIEKLRRGER